MIITIRKSDNRIIYFNQGNIDNNSDYEEKNVAIDFMPSDNIENLYYVAASNSIANTNLEFKMWNGSEWVDDIAALKLNALSYIQTKFYEAMGNNDAHCTTSLLDDNNNYIVMNNRRNDHDNDIQNMQNVVYLFDLDPNLETVSVKDYNNNIHSLNKTQIQQLIASMILSGLQLYQSMWVRKATVVSETVTTKAQIESIISDIEANGL